MRVQIQRRREAADRPVIEPDAHTQLIRRAQDIILHIAERADERLPRVLRVDQAHTAIAARAQKRRSCLHRLIGGKRRFAAGAGGIIAQHFPAGNRDSNIGRVVPVVDSKVPARYDALRAAGRLQTRRIHVQKSRSRGLRLLLRDLTAARQHGVIRRRAHLIAAVRDRKRQLLKRIGQRREFRLERVGQIRLQPQILQRLCAAHMRCRRNCTVIE